MRVAMDVGPVVARGEANDNANAILRAAGAGSSRGASTPSPCRARARSSSASGGARPRAHGHDPFSTNGCDELLVAPAARVGCDGGHVATEDCVHEHDFLERAIQLGVKSTAGYLKLPFIDDATVHRMYSELPGGYVMLSDGV